MAAAVLLAGMAVADEACAVVRAGVHGQWLCAAALENE